jgi:hypothetical protein
MAYNLCLILLLSLDFAYNTRHLPIFNIQKPIQIIDLGNHLAYTKEIIKIGDHPPSKVCDRLLGSSWREHRLLTLIKGTSIMTHTTDTQQALFAHEVDEAQVESRNHITQEVPAVAPEEITTVEISKQWDVLSSLLKSNQLSVNDRLRRKEEGRRKKEEV